ncbi:unnamed protein product [Echinostoma caproni]|uniref:2-phosphosulfolactate phosphatase n=1 Tax=Echinostoma caproni TaxID=27848 RepID=A0A183B2F4_9TREM|nr:unnamed protein product [Echinostoma caproni]
MERLLVPCPLFPDEVEGDEILPFLFSKDAVLKAIRTGGCTRWKHTAGRILDAGLAAAIISPAQSDLI